VAVETAVVIAPGGWVIWSVNGTAVRASSIAIKGFDTVGYYEIVFALAGFDADKERSWDPFFTKGGPGFETWALISAVALSALYVAGKRRKK
jgi:hypothetical protein